MNYLLLDIDDTIAPWNYQGLDAVVIDSMGIYLGIPETIADWLHKSAEKEIKIIWCTSRGPVVCALVEQKIGFKAEGQLEFFNKKAYAWEKLASILEFCHDHQDDTVILADNDIKEGLRGITNLPNNLKLVWPTDRKGCLSLADLKLIENI